jgi:hypothetical protein
MLTFVQSLALSMQIVISQTQSYFTSQSILIHCRVCGNDEKKVVDRTLGEKLSSNCSDRKTDFFFVERKAELKTNFHFPKALFSPHSVCRFVGFVCILKSVSLCIFKQLRFYCFATIKFIHGFIASP